MLEIRDEGWGEGCERDDGTLPQRLSEQAWTDRIRRGRSEALLLPRQVI